jgi:hypothetical protein
VSNLAVNSNVLHTLLHAMLRQLNIVDVQAESDLNDNDMDFLSASKARELSVLSSRYCKYSGSTIYSCTTVGIVFQQ